MESRSFHGHIVLPPRLNHLNIVSFVMISQCVCTTYEIPPHATPTAGCVKGEGGATAGKHLSVTPELSVGGITQTVNSVYKPLAFTVSAFMRLGRGDVGVGSVRTQKKQSAPLSCLFNHIPKFYLMNYVSILRQMKGQSYHGSFSKVQQPLLALLSIGASLRSAVG